MDYAGGRTTELPSRDHPQGGREREHHREREQRGEQALS